jgi:large subunit ribosomal protein L30
MPEKKTVTDKAVAPKAEKPTVKKTTTKAAATATKSKTPAAAKAPATKVKSPAVAKPEVAEVKTPKVVEEPKVVAESAKPAVKPEAKKVVKGKILKITLVKSGIGYSKRHKATLRALGFHRLNQTIEQVDTPSLRGMLAMVDHLVRIEEQGTK